MSNCYICRPNLLLGRASFSANLLFRVYCKLQTIAHMFTLDAVGLAAYTFGVLVLNEALENRYWYMPDSVGLKLWKYVGIYAKVGGAQQGHPRIW